MKSTVPGSMMVLSALMFTACIHSGHDARLPSVASPVAEHRKFVVVAVGDISCDPNSRLYNQGTGTARYCHMLGTSNLAISLKPAAVLLLGDTQYEKGAPAAYQKAWTNNWGRSELKDITYPVLATTSTAR